MRGQGPQFSGAKNLCKIPPGSSPMPYSQKQYKTAEKEIIYAPSNGDTADDLQ